MPHHKAAKKAMRQNEAKRLRNRTIRSSVRKQVKSLLRNLDTMEKKDIHLAYTDVMRALDKAWSKGIYHKNTVARKKARLAKRVVPLIKELMQTAEA